MPSFCSHFDSKHCHSCTWMGQNYADQLRRKEAKLREALGFLEPFVLETSVGSPEQNFRNRAKISITGSVPSPIVGLYGSETLDEGRELLSCPIHHPRLNELIATMPELIRTHGLVPYQIRERRGELKGLIAFHSPGSDETYLRFVLRSQELVPRIRKLLPDLQARFPSLVCVTANIQPIPHAILEGPLEIFITERHSINHRLGPFTLKLAPQAFVQTNIAVATELYQTAARWIAEMKPATMLELFCGQGAFSFFAQESAGEVIGIEVNEDAVRTASETAHTLGLTHLRFVAHDATRAEEELTRFSPELILANPPRRGLTESVKLISRSRSRHCIYSSCSVESLAADLEILAKDYVLKRVQLFDMFPHTEHFETLVWTVRR